MHVFVHVCVHVHVCVCREGIVYLWERSKGPSNLNPDHIPTVSHFPIGMNYFPLTLSNYRCKEELRFTHHPLQNACKLVGDLWKFFPLADLTGWGSSLVV